MQNILITGCSTGIGYSTAHTLHQADLNVFASARSIKDVETLRQKGLKSLLLDLNNEAGLKTAVDEMMQQCQTIDAVFHNGAYGQGGAIEDLTTDALRQQFETNVFGWHQLTRLILPIMQQQGYGKIILNSSVLGLATMPFRGAYCASKYAIEALTDALRLENDHPNIHIVLVEPGPITSQFRKNAIETMQKNINVQDSRFKAIYENRIEKEKHATKDTFELPAQAVANVVLKIMKSKRPKPRYYVTKATFILGTLKRILSTRMLDKIIKRIT